MSPSSLPNGTQSTAYSQTVSASGGTGPYTFALTAGSLPAGLSLSSGGTISGTPSGSGASSFTIEATDSVGNIGSRAYSVNIGTNSLTVNPSSLPAGTQSVAYSQTVSATGGTGPYTFALASGSLPAGLSLSSAGVISGTPSGSGSSSFSIRATDSLGNVGTRSYAVNIGTVSLTVNPSSLPGAVVGRPYSQTVSATGGTAPYTFSVSAGTLPPGLTLNASTGVISGTPTALGASSFTIQALDVNGNTGSRAYALVNRPDPAADPEVQGLINAQVAVARRFASAQVENVTRHLEGLHDRFNPCGVDFGVNLPPTDSKDRPYPAGSPYHQSPAAAARSYEPGSPAAQVARRTPNSPECAMSAGWMRSQFAFWVSGSVQFGTVAPTGAMTSNRFGTAGLTAGVDWRAMERLIVGVAVGYGMDRTEVGAYGTRSDATSVSAMAYASFRALDPWFIDAVIGYGTLGYDARRWVSNDSVLVNGTRKGSYWFGALGTSWEFKVGALKVVPYVRGEFMSGRLDGYSEQGSTSELLTFAATSFNSVSGSLGLRGSYDIPVSWGTLTPMARIEYRQAMDGSFDQSMYYTDLGASSASVFSQASSTRGLVNASAGFRARAFGGMSAELEYGTTSSGGALQSQSVRALLRLPF